MKNFKKYVWGFGSEIKFRSNIFRGNKHQVCGRISILIIKSATRGNKQQSVNKQQSPLKSLNVLLPLVLAILRLTLPKYYVNLLWTLTFLIFI
jgi:hypothetical protein